MAQKEIISGPLSLYWAPVGESFPDVDATPAGNWTLVGTSGPNNYHEDGVVIRADKTFEQFRGLGNTYPLKNFITETDMMVEVTLVDFSLAQLRLAFNNNTVGTDAGPPAIKTLNLDVGTTPTEMALLIRGTGKSPEFEGSNLQFEINRVVERGSHEFAFTKGDGVGAALVFAVMLDTSGGFPGVVGQIVAATS
jgi:hypothetical protein